MRSRRGSLLSGTTFGDAILMYKAGDVVKPVIVTDQFFSGVVRDVDTKTNKITVAWGGGATSQHDPEEIMPMPFFGAAHQDGSGRKVASRRMRGEDVEDLVHPFDEASPECPCFCTGGEAITSASKEVEFLRPDGTVFAKIRDAEGAFDLWNQGRWDVRIGDDFFKARDFKGREAIEKLFGKKYRLNAADPSLDQFCGEPDTHGINEPRGGGFSIMHDLADDLREESNEFADVDPRFARIKAGLKEIAWDSGTSDDSIRQANQFIRKATSGNEPSAQRTVEEEIAKKSSVLTANAPFMTGLSPFEAALKKAIDQKIQELKRDGTVGMGIDNLMQVVRPPSTSLAGAPTGTNARYYYKEMFRNICGRMPFCRNASGAIALVSKPGAIMERQPRFMMTFNGKPWGELYYNMTGYVAEHGIPIPSDSGVSGLQVGERSLSFYKSEIAKANREWATRGRAASSCGALELDGLKSRRADDLSGVPGIDEETQQNPPDSINQTDFLADDMEALLNRQVGSEFYSAYLYYMVAAAFQSKGLVGFQNWMEKQGDGEIDHAMKVYNYLVDTGSALQLPMIPAPQIDPAADVVEITRMILDHEMRVTEDWKRIGQLSKQQDNPATCKLVQEFMVEQVEEEDAALTLHQKVQLADTGSGILLIDNDLRDRGPIAKTAGSMQATGEMGMHDIQPGGEWYERAKEIADAAKAIQQITARGGYRVSFLGMKPFDVYQGPYAVMTEGKLWGTDDPGLYYFEFRLHDGVTGDPNDIAVDILERKGIGPRFKKTAMDFPTQDAMDKYLKEHPDADKTNHRVVETKKEPSKHPNLFTPRSAWKKTKSIGGKSPSEYAALWGSTKGQGAAHFYNYGSEKQEKDDKFYDEFINGKGGIKDVLADIKRNPDGYEPKDHGEMMALWSHVEAERAEKKSKKASDNLRSRRAMYWCAPDRTYRLTQQEQAGGLATCPKCRIEMSKERFTRSDKLWTCPECGFKVPTSKAVTKVEITVPRGTEVDVTTENDGSGPSPVQTVTARRGSRIAYADPQALTDLPRMELNAIASLIYSDWKNVNYAAKPYLEAMSTLRSVSDMYMCDPGTSIVAYFLSNATSWRGDVAKAVKKELQRRIRR